MILTYSTLSCEHPGYPGCTQEYRDVLADSQTQWVSGKVWGYLFLGHTHHFYAAWRAAVWNSGCFTASPGLGHYGLNINGRSVLEMEDSSSHLLDRDRVR